MDAFWVVVVLTFVFVFGGMSCCFRWVLFLWLFKLFASAGFCECCESG